MADLRKLKDAAAQAAEKGKYKRALRDYLALEQHEPHEGGWARRAGDMFRLLGDHDSALAAFERAARKYAEAGFGVKAVAVCRTILRLDPAHRAAQERLAALLVRDRPDGAEVAAAPAPAASPTIPPGAPLSAVVLGDVIPDARPQGTHQHRVTEIPLDEDDPVLELDRSWPGAGASGSAAGTPAAAGPAVTAPAAGPAFTGMPQAPARSPAASEPELPRPVTLPPVSPAPALRTGTGPGPERSRSAALLDSAPAAAGASLAGRPEDLSAALRQAAESQATIRRGRPVIHSVSVRAPPAASGLAGAAATTGEISLDDADEIRSTAAPPGATTGEISLDDADEIRSDSPEEVEEGIEIHVAADDEDWDISDADLEQLTLQAAAALERPDAGGTTQRSRALLRTPLFSELSPAALERLLRCVGMVELDAGDVLFRQGDVGDRLYVVVEGAVGVVAEGPPRVPLARLGEGEFFGEVAIATEEPRTATVEALCHTELLSVDRVAMSEIVAAEPAVLKVLLRFLRDRLLDRLVRTSPLFAPFGGEDRQLLASRFRFLEAEAGAELVRQGQVAPGIYLLLAGQAEVVRKGGSGQPVPLATLGVGDLFGEISLLAGSAALASVLLTRKSFVLELPARDFREVIMTHPQVLMIVGELAEERKRQLEAMAAGQGGYREGHLDVV
jgi:CRP-like cAMP-binding protein/tetratricopeptide (TPR) repeat protein